MKSKWSMWAIGSMSLVVGLGVGCVATPEPEPDEAPRDRVEALAPGWLAENASAADPSRDVALEIADIDPAPDLVGWTSGGDLAVIDGDTGDVRQAIGTLDLAGARDVAYDPWTARAWIAESDDEGAQGEIASYPVFQDVTGVVLGARAHEASLAGEARLLATPSGVVSFEDGGGGRWRLLGAGGASSPPASAPRPMSAWLDGGAVRALAYGAASGELDAVGATLHAGAVGGVTGGPFGIAAGTLPPCARVVPAPLRGGALMLDVSGSFLSVRHVAGASTGPASIAPLGATGLRIEDAVSLDGGRLAAVLVSGTTEIVALEIAPDLTVASMATVALPGEPSPSTALVAHDLVRLGHGRIAAATSAGVFSIEVRKDPLGVHLTPAARWRGEHLRGPIAPIAPPS